MKQDEGLYRVARFLKRLILGLTALVVVVAAVGYLFLIRQVDPEAAWASAKRELDSGFLHYGERIVRTAHVYRRRPSNYYRAANGLLVATDQRIIFIGLEPRDKLEGADAPSAILTSVFPNDTTLSVSTRRIYALTAHGIILRRGNRVDQYAASSGDAAELDSLASFVEMRQREQRSIAAQDRALRRKLAELLRQPLYYVVQRGDAISTIASRYDATAAQIRQWNQLPNDKVRIGQRLLVRPGSH